MAKEKKEKEQPKKPQATLSLAVKYRPRVLADVVGQDSQVSIIKGMHKSGEYPGAILITGPTGTGKTTLARILATYMNSDTKKVTESMAYKLGDKHPDVITINAGTHGKVEDIRTLVKGSRSAPMSNYRIIVIDECVTGETPIVIDHNGTTVTAEQLHEDTSITHILSRNLETGVDELQPINHRFKLEKDSSQLLDITLEDGTVLSVTENHPIWSVTRQEYVRADELTVDDELHPLVLS